MEKLGNTCKMKDIRNTINDLVDFSSLIEISGSLSQLSSKENGCYKWSGEISSVTGTWVINKMGVIYTAINVEDPRVVLNSTNLSNWYSPYASWHV